MNIFKIALRVWFTVTSLAGFLGGWILLAHSPKPKPLTLSTSNSAATSSLTLPPIPSLDSLIGGSNPNNAQQFFQSQSFNSVQPSQQTQQQTQPFAQPQQTFRPRLHTSGS